MRETEEKKKMYTCMAKHLRSQITSLITSIAIDMSFIMLIVLVLKTPE
jgi:hypothetical protein